jgi:hypothetical protein
VAEGTQSPEKPGNREAAQECNPRRRGWKNNRPEQFLAIFAKSFAVFAAKDLDREDRKVSAKTAKNTAATRTTRLPNSLPADDTGTTQS